MRKEASKSVVMPDVGAQSAGKAPKKKKRIKKIRKNALEEEVGSRSTHVAAPEKKKVKKRKVKKASDPGKEIIPVVEEIKEPEIVTPSLLEKAEVNTDSTVVAAEEQEDEHEDKGALAEGEDLGPGAHGPVEDVEGPHRQRRVRRRRQRLWHGPSRPPAKLNLARRLAGRVVQMDLQSIDVTAEFEPTEAE